MSKLLQVAKDWPGFAGLKHLVIFGDSYSSVGYQPSEPHPTPQDPLGTPFPGKDLWTGGGPNWVGHLVSKLKRSPNGHSLILDSGGNEAEPLQSPIVVYDYAVGGHTVSGVENQIKQQFMSHVGRKPEWAAWTAADTLFVTWIGVNDCASPNMRLLDIMKNLFDLQKTLYGAGARNFLFIDVPPMDRSPAVPASLPLPRYDRWNIALQSSAEAFSSAHSAVTALLFSSHGTFTRVLDDPVGHNFGAKEVRRKKGEIWMDRLHPTSKMHSFVARDLVKFLGTVHKFEEEN